MQLLKLNRFMGVWPGLASLDLTQKLLRRLALEHQRSYEHRKSDIWSGLFLGS
jgi:hypothetical protein